MFPLHTNPFGEEEGTAQVWGRAGRELIGGQAFRSWAGQIQMLGTWGMRGQGRRAACGQVCSENALFFLSENIMGHLTALLIFRPWAPRAPFPQALGTPDGERERERERERARARTVRQGPTVEGSSPLSGVPLSQGPKHRGHSS